MFKKVFIPCLALATINFLGAYLSYKIGKDYPWGVGVLTSGALVFFMQLSSPSNESKDSRLRSAIAAGIVIQYLALVATVAFFEQGPKELPPITQTLITNFTSIVGVVIAFYFGSSAYIEAHKKENKPSSEKQ